jgi:cell division initiation protein
MPLTSLDIESRRFKKELWGYRKADVEAFLRSAADALSQAVLEKEELARRINELGSELEQFRQRERTLIEALSSAEHLADQRKALAEHEAERIIGDARSQAERIIARTRDEVTRVEQQIIRLKVERESFESKLAGLINEHRRLLDVRRRDIPAAGGAGETVRFPSSRTTVPPPHAEEER